MIECFDKRYCAVAGQDCTKEKMLKCQPSVINDDAPSIIYYLALQLIHEGKEVLGSPILNIPLEAFYRLGGNFEEARRIIRLASMSAEIRMKKGKGGIG